MSLCTCPKIIFDGQNPSVRTVNYLSMAWNWEIRNFKPKHILNFLKSLCVMPSSNRIGVYFIHWDWWSLSLAAWIIQNINLLIATPALLTFVLTVKFLLVLLWDFRRLQHHSQSGAFCLSVKTVVLSELQQCFKQSAHTLQNHSVWCQLWRINQPYIIIYWNNNSSFSFRKQYIGTLHFFRVIEHRFWKSFTYWFELRLVCIIFQLWLSVKDSSKEIYFVPNIFLVSYFLWWLCKNWLFTNQVTRKETRFFSVFLHGS